MMSTHNDARGKEIHKNGKTYVETYKGVLYELPTKPKHSEIDGYELQTKEQCWRIPEPPEGMFDEIEYDSDGDAVFSEEQYAYIDNELDKWERGYWFFNCGKPVYVTGDHYFYLTCFTLENGDKPDYWDPSRIYFYFHDTARGNSMCDGILRAKRRRRGATSEAVASQLKTAITTRKAFCGLTSKTNKDAKDTFLLMTKNAFVNLPVWAKPRVYDEDSQTELLFRKEKQRGQKKKRAMTKGKLQQEQLGLESRLDFRPTALNSYDSGRQEYFIGDEGGKYPPDVPFNEYWAIVQQTLRLGGRRVGFANLPSTCNKLTKGGRGYKILWDDSDQSKSEKTGSGLWQFFEPGYLCYEPYIDKYGNSIVNKPTKEQAKWMKERYGASDLQCSMSAVEWLDYEESLIKDDARRKEFRRMYPRAEKDAFDYEDADNIYETELIGRQREWLSERGLKYRLVNFYRKADGAVDMVDSKDGVWKVLHFPAAHEINGKIIDRFGNVKPANASKYVITVDPFKSTQVSSSKVSKAAAGIWTKYNNLDPENTGLLIAVYWHRPKLRKNVHEQVLMAAEYYGAEICHESDYDDYIEFLMEQKKLGYAKERPKSTIDPNRKRRVGGIGGKEFGVKSADGFSYGTMIEKSKAYVIDHWSKIYFDEVLEQLEEYDEHRRTDFDLAVMFQLGCVAIADPVKPPKAETKKATPFLHTYQIKM